MAAKVKKVDKHSPAARCGIKPGDCILSINGSRIVDVLDYMYYSYENRLAIVLRGEDGSERSVLMRKREGEEPGIDFESYLMDKARSCANKCVFCFVDQMPKGMRENLYFKDDDARLSFLTGNYITLTNMSQREAQRIIDLHISPINISVHTTKPDLRTFMLGNRRGGESLEIMRRFAQADIRMNCQIVLCPGINDGEELRRTLRDLKDMYPAVSSVSVVPVGITKHRCGLYPLTPVDKAKAEEVIAMVDAVGEECMAMDDYRVFYCSDELYLLAEREMPKYSYYDDFPQFENGVGMLRTMEDDFKFALEDCESFGDIEPFSAATGQAACGFITGLIDLMAKRCNNMEYQTYAIRNDFFGEMVTVAGLVTGQDLIAQLKGRDLKGRLLIPRIMVRDGVDKFLDDVTLKEAEQELGVPIVTVGPEAEDLIKAIAGETGS